MNLRGQWSFSFALIALAAVAFAFVVMALAAARFSFIDYSEDLYLLKYKSMVVNNTISFYTWSPSLCFSKSVTQYFKQNTTIYYYLIISLQKYLMAARPSRADKFINYTIYLCLLSCEKAIGPGGAPGYLFYISAYSTLDYLPTLEINGMFLEYALLSKAGGYYAPSAPLIVAFSNASTLRIVDYPIEVDLECPPASG